MASKYHVVQIDKGVKVWNSWREKNPFIVPDLSNAHLSGAHLREANLSAGCRDRLP